jgi:hypothetical protein
MTVFGCNWLLFGVSEITFEAICELDDDNSDSCLGGMAKLWWICVWDKPSSEVLAITIEKLNYWIFFFS